MGTLPLRAAVARLLLVALAPMALDGCVSVGLSRSPADGGAGGGQLEVAVYQKTADRDAGSRAPFPVLSELLRLDGGAPVAVAKSMSSAWSLGGLPPGRYALRVTRRIDAQGNVVPLKSPGDRTFDVRKGERVRATVVLEKVPVFWIVVAAVTIVLLVFLAIELGREGALPSPPPLPFPPPFAAVVLVDLGPVGETGGPRAAEPLVAEVFPAKDSVVAARRVAVSFFVTEALDPRKIEDGAVLALGSLSGEIPGAVSYLPDEQLLRFSPGRDFSPGETVTVTLDLGKVESLHGKSGNERVSTTFRVPAD